MSRRAWVGFGLVAALTMGPTAPAGAMVGFDVTGATYLTGQNSLTRTNTGRLMFVDNTYSASLGGVAGDPPYAIGAEVHGSISPKLGLQTRAVSSQLTDFGTTATALTQVRGADATGSSNVGQQFTLATTLTQGASNYMSLDDSFSASIDLVYGMKLDAGGRGCLSGCLGADFKINLGEGTSNLVTLNSNGQAFVLGAAVGSGPFNYTDPTGIVTFTGNAPDFDAKSTNIAGGPAVASRQALAGVSIDAAQAFATAVGLPFKLKDELGGFDYTILSASIGAGLDIVKKVAFETITAGANYVFSAPVSVFNAATNAWSDLTTSWFTNADGSELMVKAPGAASIGVTRYDVLGGNLVTSVDLVGYVTGNVTALGLNGYGIEFGPLLDKTLKFDIGTIGMGSNSEFATVSQVGQSFNLTFAPNTVDGQDPCAAGCSITGFLDLQDTIGSENGGGLELRDSRIRLVNNLGAGCAPGLIANCQFGDDDFDPIARQVLVDTTGQNDAISGEDIRGFAASLAAPDFLAAQSDADQVFARLRMMGIDPFNPAPFAGMGPGAPFPTEPILESRQYQLSFGANVPEPSSWLLMIGGFGFAGAALRRRRSAVRMAA